MTKEYSLVAKDSKGKQYIWGYFFKSVEAARQALLPGTWAIDEEGNKVAEREEEKAS